MSDLVNSINGLPILADRALKSGNGTNIDTALSGKAPLASPALTGTPTAPTAASGTNTDQIATTAFVKDAVDNGLAVADAMVYKGTLAGGSTGSYGALTPAATKGETYKVTAAGKIDGVAVEIGDMLICNADNTAAATSSNYTTIAANWDFIQANIDGAVTGPASAVDGHVAVFDGSNGKTVKDGGAIGTAASKTLVTSWSSTTSDGNIPSEKLVKDSLDSKQASLPTSGTASGTYAINVSGNAATASSVDWTNVANKATASTGGVYGIVTYTTVLLDEV